MEIGIPRKFTEQGGLGWLLHHVPGIRNLYVEHHVYDSFGPLRAAFNKRLSTQSKWLAHRRNAIRYSVSQRA